MPLNCYPSGILTPELPKRNRIHFGKSFISLGKYSKEASISVRAIKGRSKICRNINIYSQTRDTAASIRNLIVGAQSLFIGSSCSNIYDLSILRKNISPLDILKRADEYDDEGGTSGYFCGSYQGGYSHGIETACLIAEEAFKEKSFIHAIAKYNFSLYLVSTDIQDLMPDTKPAFCISPIADFQVRLAHAIIAAYSCIEDLGLEVRASKTIPSYINGSWNPPVLKDLRDRLKANSVNERDLLTWTLRGGVSRIGKKKKIPYVNLCSWSSGVMVRDCEVTVTDAINYSGWLRSAVAAHGFGSLTKSVSIYDVHNVQHLARRLILESLGFWKYKGWVKGVKRQ